MNKMDERILVVSREGLFENEELVFQGVMTDEETVRHLMGKFEDCFEVRRGDAEENEEWKQPIPYVILKRGNDVFMYERLVGGTEERLHNKKSIGLGGHMNPIYDTFGELFVGGWDSILVKNINRELEEEVRISRTGIPQASVIGLINDDENEVGRVHIGILAVIELPEIVKVRVRETDQLQGDWVSLEGLMEDEVFESLETWSQYAVKALVK